MEAYINDMLKKRALIRKNSPFIEPVQPPVVVQEPIPPVVVQEPIPSVVVQEPVQPPVVVQEPIPSVVVQEPIPSVVVQEPVQPPVVVQEPVQPIVSDIVNTDIPRIIFIVPYRDRPQQLHFFQEQMKKVLSTLSPTYYKIYFLHQQDSRKFNRGAMKNIGYIAVKKLYPNDYKNITLVFNDVDTMPYIKNFLKYETIPGTVKHFYGYKFALGGIVSITAGDFEKTGGFPNFWAWGYEDNMLKLRVDKAGLRLDYTQFYPIKDGNILHLSDGNNRDVSRTEFETYTGERYTGNNADGFNDINELVYNIEDETGFINVTGFTSRVPEETIITRVHNLANGNAPFNGRRRSAFGRMF